MSGAYVFSLTFGGRERDYRLHVPPAAASGRPLPLVLNLHGATQNALLEEITSDMDPSSDKNGYLVAYPDGTRISTVLTPDPVAKQAQYGWNAGQCCGLPVTKHINDVGFLLDVIRSVATHTLVDLRRVYVTGISNGGMMAYAMAAEASSRVAAVSSVSGQVELPTIHPSRAVPTMEFHSLNDPIAKWNGVANKKPRLRLSVMQGIDQWVKADGCGTRPHDGRTIVGAADSISAGETATPVTYIHCRSGSEVALWRFTGSGHVWPGSPLNMGPAKNWILAGVGEGIILVNANEAMWQFFRRYSLPARV
jgi:polyhydroxybutyrate depolymerase